jgi:hypothetical protein
MECTRLIDINENRHRYFFTREATQKDMEAKFGLSVQTIGKYYPNRSLAIPSCPPLAIQLRGSEQSVEVAAIYVQKILEEGPSPLSQSQAPKEHQFTKKIYLPFQPEPGRISLVRSHILGPPPSASHLVYIARVAGPGCHVTLRGQGSGHVEPGMKLEQLSEPMHILLQCLTDQELNTATILAEDLIMVVKHEYELKKNAIILS